jgi:hypothetical protein
MNQLKLDYKVEMLGEKGYLVRIRWLSICDPLASSDDRIYKEFVQYRDKEPFYFGDTIDIHVPKGTRCINVFSVPEVGHHPSKVTDNIAMLYIFENRDCNNLRIEQEPFSVPKYLGWKRFQILQNCLCVTTESGKKYAYSPRGKSFRKWKYSMIRHHNFMKYVSGEISEEDLENHLTDVEKVISISDRSESVEIKSLKAQLSKAESSRDDALKWLYQIVDKNYITPSLLGRIFPSRTTYRDLVISKIREFCRESRISRPRKVVQAINRFRGEDSVKTTSSISDSNKKLE